MKCSLYFSTEHLCTTLCHEVITTKANIQALQTSSQSGYEAMLQRHVISVLTLVNMFVKNDERWSRIKEYEEIL